MIAMTPHITIAIILEIMKMMMKRKSTGVEKDQ